jgi:hypothetical protein
MKHRLSFCRDSDGLKDVFYDVIRAWSEYICKVTYTSHIPADIFGANVKEIVDQEYLYLILLKIQYVFVVVSTVPKLWVS